MLRNPFLLHLLGILSHESLVVIPFPLVNMCPNEGHGSELLKLKRVPEFDPLK